MRALVLTAFVLAGLASGLSGCAQNPNRVSAMQQPQLLAAPRAVYSVAELQAMQIAVTQYVKDNGASLAASRPVVAGGTILPAGNLEGQSYRPGTAMLRQLGYLAFDAPDVQIWIDPAPVGCIRKSCTFIARLVTSRQNLIIPVDY